MKIPIPFTGKAVNVSMQDNERLFGSNSDEKRMIQESTDQLKKYKSGKENLETKIVENEQWYKSRHWDYIRNEKYADDPEPVTAYLFNTIANKHADAMDAYPGCNILPREADDKQLAEMLTKIVPLELEYNDFLDVWDAHWWEKLKHGLGIYGIFYDPDGGNQLGAAVIKNIDILNIYWEPGITDIQESGSVYITKLISKEKYQSMYPDASLERASKLFEPKHYITDDNIDTADYVLMVDRYYKKDGELHFFKYCGENVHAWTERPQEEQAEIPEGLYQHGEYPFVFDVLFPEKDTLHGFGYIDILKNPQIYIDKLDQIISKNAFTSGRNRYLVSKSAGVRIEDLADPSKEFIEFEGSLREDQYAIFKQDPVNPVVYNHRGSKIEEVKDISANEFSRGEAGGGVTAASAIAMLQQAADKISRDMIKKSYSKFSQAVYFQLEIIRQFYDIERSYRIENNDEYTFEKFSNKNMKPQPLPEVPGMNQQYRKPIFDIKIVPEQQSPFKQIAHNELAKELYKLGFFNPEQAQAALVALEMMQFESKSAIQKLITENSVVLQQIQAMVAENEKLKMIVQQLTGEDLGAGGMQGGQSGDMQR